MVPVKVVIVAVVPVAVVNKRFVAFRVVPVALVKLTVCKLEVPFTVKFLVDDAHRKLASPANTPPLLYWISVVAPPGVAEPPVVGSQEIPP